MYNQIDAVLSQYDMEINGVTKGRGSYICNTSKGMKLLIPFCGSKEKGEFLRQYLSELDKNGFHTEQIFQNKEGQVVTEDEVTGERFLVKDYIAGKELDTGSIVEMIEAVRMLAKYHMVSQDIELLIPEKMKENEKSVVESCKRHGRELIKVKNYIRNRKKKNEFERIYMQYFAPMSETAERSIFCLEKQESEICQVGICHGDYNQHNVICTENGWQMIHFENSMYNWRITDFANFLRKMMEKHNWDEKLGAKLLEEYQSVHELKQEELQKLYGILLFPEKFWKITNHYMNSRKTWISERDIEKLKKVITQEKERLNFVENLFHI